MSPAAGTARDLRVLLLLPFGRDAELAERLLGKAGFAVGVCARMEDLTGELAAGAGAVVIEEEGLDAAAAGLLEEALRAEPTWSNLPVVVLTRSRGPAPGVRRFLERLDHFHGVTLLQRPTETMTLVSTLRVALQARRRQYELRDLVARLGEDVRRRDEFLAMLAHELRNPLAPIGHAAELLRARPASAEVTTWATDVIARQTRHLTRLVGELLDVSRVVHGRIELQREPVDLRRVVNEAAESHGSGIERRRQELTVRQAEGALVVDGDPVRLAQVIGNLLDNASKYSPEGARIEITTRAADGHAEVRVRDEGRGIEPEALPRVFDVFFQAGTTLARTDGGLGLGLGLVKGLVELHGGEVAADSPGLGLGTEMVVRLPLGAADAASPAASPGVENSSEPAGSRGVLVVEDNPDVADSFAVLLESLGHRVRIARCGEEGLAAAGAEPFDAVFLDLGLPDLPGDEVARRLRGVVPAGCTLIALSGYAESSLGPGASPFDHYLLKPASLDDVLRVLGAAEPGAGSGAV